MFSDQSPVQLMFYSFRHFTDQEYRFNIYCTARQELVSFTAFVKSRQATAATAAKEASHELIITIFEILSQP